MAIHTFIACDACNQDGYRIIDQRRGQRDAGRTGRRNTDGRSWFEGSESEATASGWLVAESKHFCPDCQERGLHKIAT